MSAVGSTARQLATPSPLWGEGRGEVLLWNLKLGTCSFALALLAFTACPAFAPPPMITGDVPTADHQRFELYTGLRYQENEAGVPARQLPFTELVYGLTPRQELTFEIAYLQPKARARLRRCRHRHQVPVLCGKH